MAEHISSAVDHAVGAVRHEAGHQHSAPAYALAPCPKAIHGAVGGGEEGGEHGVDIARYLAGYFGPPVFEVRKDMSHTAIGRHHFERSGPRGSLQLVGRRGPSNQGAIVHPSKLAIGAATTERQWNARDLVYVTVDDLVARSLSMPDNRVQVLPVSSYSGSLHQERDIAS